MNSYSKLMLAASLSITSGVTLAAEVVPLHNNDSAFKGHNAVAKKRAFAQVERNGKVDSYQLTDSIAKHFASQTSGALDLISHRARDGRQYVKYQQTYRGFEIHNHQVVMALDSKGIIEQGYGALVRGIEKDLPSLPKVNDAIGKKELQRIIDTYYSDQERVFSHQSVEPVIYMDNSDRAHFAYRIQFFTDVKEGDSQPEQIMAFVEVSTGKLLSKQDVLNRAVVAGGGAGGNDKQQRAVPYRMEDEGLSPRQTFTVQRQWDSWNATDGNVYKCKFNADNVITRDYKHATTSVSSPFEYTCYKDSTINNERETNGARSPLNDAHFNAQLTSEMFVDYLGLKPFANSKIKQNVHYGQNMDQAFYINGEVAYGDGQWIFHPMTSLDVVAHEIAHGFTEEYGTGNKKYMTSGESGGVNEAFSDIAGAAAEYYLYNGTMVDGQPWTDDWMSNQGSYRFDGALRYFDEPTRDNVSIDHMRDLEPTTPIHYSAGIFNKAFYLLVTSAVEDGEVSPWNTEYAFFLFGRANRDCWVGNSGFGTAADCVVDQADLVSARMAQRGVTKADGSAWSAIELQNHIRKAFSRVGINLRLNDGLESDFSYSGRFLTFEFEDKSRINGRSVQADGNDVWSVLWDFGDGNTSTELNPSHTYASAGKYEVTLTTTNESHNYSDKITMDAIANAGFCDLSGNYFDEYYIDSVKIKDDVINSGSAGYTDHSGTPVSVIDGVAFDVDISAGYHANSVNSTKNFYLWVDLNNDGKFGKVDELVYSGSDKNKVTATTSVTGKQGDEIGARAIVSYNYLTEPCGTVSFGEVEDFRLKVLDNSTAPTLVVDTVSGTNEVTFNNGTNDGRIASWHWNFGDGKTSNQKSPTHQYAKKGNYTVSVEAKNSRGEVISDPWSTTVNFDTVTRPEIRYVATDLNVVFDGFASDYPVGSTVEWDFDNGQSSTEFGPVSVDYTAAGSYNVKLKITNPDNTNGVETSTIVNVTGVTYTPEFTASNTDLVGNFSNNSGVPANLSSSQSDATLIWDFGDGSQPQQVQVADFGADNSYTYSAAGTYTVSLTIKYYNDKGDQVTAGPVTQQVTVTDPAVGLQYCDASSVTDYEHIASTNFNNHGSLTNSNASGAVTVVNVGDPITMNAGQAISYTIVGGFDSQGPYEENYHVWIDLNGDGKFGGVNDWRDDTSERVVVEFDTNAVGQVTGTFTIPRSKVAWGETNTRMRVMQYYSSFATSSVDPCSTYGQGNFDTGEIEDYEVKIIKN